MTTFWSNRRGAGALALGFGVVLSLNSAEVLAQSVDGASSTYLADLNSCRSISEDAARLACYDAISTTIVQAEAKGDLKIVDRQQAKQARRSLFGFRLPSISLFRGKDGDEEDVSEIDSVITAVRPLGGGKYTIRIKQDDATWQTTEASPFFRQPDTGADVHIERGSLGTYFLKVNGGKRVRAQRVE
ncbi:hypothetical protein [Novosphingopyxis iocasae]|uniref:hypothetical protein n=1 Tax=Novosphingopyxis iocasae TaxID=2762729 RepID=UPI0016515817|nr:hypothetical protein [Novosphingopyxis iocasae]